MKKLFDTLNIIEEKTSLFYKGVVLKFQLWLEMATRPFRTWLRPKFSTFTLEKIELHTRKWWLHSYFLLIVAPSVFILPFVQGAEEPSMKAMAISLIFFGLINPIKALFIFCIKLTIRENINEATKKSLNSEIPFWNSVLYLRRFETDRNITLCLPFNWLEPFNTGGMGSGAEMGHTFDRAVVRALGFHAPVVKLAAEQLEDTGFATLELPIGVSWEEWFPTFKLACSNSSLIVVNPLVEDESGLMREIAYICEHGLLFKTVFIMPSEMDTYINGEKKKISDLWESSRKLLQSKLSIQLPKFSPFGGIILYENERMNLYSWICGQIWYSKSALSQLIQTRNLKQSAVRFGFMFAKSGLLYASMLSILHAGIIVFVVWLLYVFSVSVFGTLENKFWSPLFDSQHGLALFFVTALAIHFLSLWSMARKFCSLLYSVVLAIFSLFGIFAIFRIFTFFIEKINLVPNESLLYEIVIITIFITPIVVYFIFLWFVGSFVFLLDPSKGVLPSVGRKQL